MTEQELNEIKVRCNKTVNGKWFAVIEGRDQTGGSSFIMTGVENIDDVRNKNRGEDVYLIGATVADIDFIANARQDIPKLIAEIEQLKKLLK
jgi:hypothetical protein